MTADLTWEAEQRPRAGAAALGGALLGVAGAAVSLAGIGDAPPAPLLDSLKNLEAPGAIDSQPSARTELFDFFGAHGGTLIISAVLLGLSSVLVGYALTMLARFVRARTDKLPRFMLQLALVGGGMFLIGSVLTAFGTNGWIDDLLASDRTVGAFDDIKQTAPMIGGQLVSQLGGLLLAASYVVINLHAMRTGLLPRGWAYLGMLAGIVTIIPIGAVSQLAQPIWLIAFALLALGRWRGGEPEAWRTGTAVPWPSGAELREERLRTRGKLREPDPEPVEQRAAKAHPSSKKRKRKRRS